MTHSGNTQRVWASHLVSEGAGLQLARLNWDTGGDWFQRTAGEPWWGGTQDFQNKTGSDQPTDQDQIMTWNRAAHIVSAASLHSLNVCLIQIASKKVPDCVLMATNNNKRSYQAFWPFCCLRCRLNSKEASTCEGQSAASWRLREQKPLAAILCSAAAGEEKKRRKKLSFKEAELLN